MTTVLPSCTEIRDLAGVTYHLDGHEVDWKTSPGTLLDQCHARTLLPYPTPAGLRFMPTPA